MNQDHIVAGVGGVSVTTMVATVLQHYQGVPADVAGSEAGLVVLGLGVLYAFGRAVLSRWHVTVPVVPVPPAS